MFTSLHLYVACVQASGFACASVHISFWVSVRGCYHMYVSACLWISVTPVRLQILWSLPGKPRMKSDAGEWLGRPSAQIPSGSKLFSSKMRSPVSSKGLQTLGCFHHSRPPGSPVSPFLMDLMSWGECLEVKWDFKIEIKKGNCIFSSPFYSFFLIGIHQLWAWSTRESADLHC